MRCFGYMTEGAGHHSRLADLRFCTAVWNARCDQLARAAVFSPQRGGWIRRTMQRLQLQKPASHSRDKAMLQTGRLGLWFACA